MNDYKNNLVITKPQIFVNLHTNKLIQDRMIVNGSSVNRIIETEKLLQVMKIQKADAYKATSSVYIWFNPLYELQDS